LQKAGVHELMTLVNFPRRSENRHRFSGAAERIEASHRTQQADWNQVSFGKEGRNSLSHGGGRVMMHAPFLL
jgi:hypothetical protein